MTFTCPCGKEFYCQQGLAGHSRWCPDRNKLLSSDFWDDEERKIDRHSMNSESANIFDIVQNSNFMNNIDDDDDDEEEEYAHPVQGNLIIKYKCNNCPALFENMDDYVTHYTEIHLNLTSIAIDNQNGESSIVNGGERCGLDQNGRDVIDKNLTSNSTVQNNNAYCQRCRNRILSGGEDNEAFDGGQKKRKIDNEESTDASAANVNSAPVIFIDDGVSTDQPPPLIPSGKIKQENRDSPSTDDLSKEKNTPFRRCVGSPPVSNLLSIVDERSASASPRLAAAPSKISASEHYDTLKQLLKDANAVTKPQKVLILNFIYGNKVNPYPSNGPINTIRLGEKMEQIPMPDGSEKTIIKETFIRLNYETGKWDKIERTK